MIADYVGELWLTVGGPSSNMSEDYHRAVREGRTIFGRMGYAGVMKRLMETWDCTYDQAKTIFGRMGYDGRVAIVMRDHGLSEEDARSHIGSHAYDGRVASVMRDRGFTNEEDARSHIGSHAYDGRVASVMRDHGFTNEENARSHIGSHAYDGRVASVMRDRGFTNEEDARSHIGEVGYAAAILAIMGFFGCNEKEARSMFGKEAGTASGEARRIDDDREECEIEGCRRLQASMSNPLCQVCTRERNMKRKSGEIEKEINRCIMCERTEDEYAFKSKAYCRRCYDTEDGKMHRAARKKETVVLCDESGCNRKAHRGGKCKMCKSRIG
jgi:hypothetical protein